MNPDPFSSPPTPFLPLYSETSGAWLDRYAPRTASTIVVGLFGNLELPIHVDNRQSFASVELSRPQMWQDLFRRIPSPEHGEDRPVVVQSIIHTGTSLAQAGHFCLRHHLNRL